MLVLVLVWSWCWCGAGVGVGAGVGAVVQICTAESGVCCTCLVTALYFKCSLSAINKDVGKDMGYSVFRPHDQGVCVMTTCSGMILSGSF